MSTLSNGCGSDLAVCSKRFVLRRVALQLACDSIGRILGECRDVPVYDKGHQCHLLVSLHNQ